MRVDWKIVCVATIFVAACAGSLPDISPNAVERAATKWSGIDKAQLTSGRELFITKCSGCHSLPQPSLYTDDEWKAKLDEMAERAKISHDEKEQIYQYLFSNAKQ